MDPGLCREWNDVTLDGGAGAFTCSGRPIRCNCALGKKYAQLNGQPIWDSVEQVWFMFTCDHIIPSTPYGDSKGPHPDAQLVPVSRRHAVSLKRSFQETMGDTRHFKVLQTIQLAALPSTPEDYDRNGPSTVLPHTPDHFTDRTPKKKVCKPLHESLQD